MAALIIVVNLANSIEQRSARISHTDRLYNRIAAPLELPNYGYLLIVPVEKPYQNNSSDTDCSFQNLNIASLALMQYLLLLPAEEPFSWPHSIRDLGEKKSPQMIAVSIQLLKPSALLLCAFRS